MPAELLVGVDLGTTVLKAAAFEAGTGRALACSVRRLAVRVGPKGEREQSVAGLDGALRAVFAELRAALGGRWRRVAGVGLAAQGGSGLVADRETGRAHMPLVLWNDARAFPYLPRVARRRPAEFWRRRTWREGPGMGLGRLLWLQEKRPELFKPANIYVGAGEYAFFRMTGRWRQDPCNAIQMGCYDVPGRRLDAELLGLVGLPLDFVAPLRRGHETNPLSPAGARLLGLPAGTPVAGPYMDHEAGYLSAAGVSRRPLQCSLGTAWVGNFAMPEGAAWRSPVQLVLPAVVGEGWLVTQPLLTGNVTWNWALAELVDRDQGKALAKLDAIFGRELLPPDGLVALPWFNMPNPLSPGALGGGCFFGLCAQTGREELLRALAASLAYEFRRVFRAVAERRAADSLILGGGAGKGAFFRTLFAALFAPLPVFQPVEEDLCGTRGTLWAFDRRVARAAVRRVPAPSAALRARIARGYERYLAVFERLYGGAAAGGPVTFGSRRAR
jgi:sugar (pentulose or hexulose) kinase